MTFNISPYSLLMALTVSTVGVYVCLLLEKKVEWRTLKIWSVGIGLTILRFLLPVEISCAKIIKIRGLPSIAQKVSSTLINNHFAIEEWLFLLWGAGAGIFLIRLAFSLYRQEKLIKALSFAQNDRITRIYEQAAEAVAVMKRGKAGVLLMSGSPIMVGFLRPHVVVPASYLNASDEQLNLILQHEITHYLGGDPWIKLAVEMLCCLLWWNPAVYCLRSAIYRLLEMRCDRRVCARLSKKEQGLYFKTLLDSLKSGISQQKCFSLSYIGHTNEKQWKQRITQILPQHQKPPKKWPALLAITLNIVLFLGSYSFLIQPAFSPTEADMEGYSIYKEPGEGTFILRYADGTLMLYRDNHLCGEIILEDLAKENFSSIPIIDSSLGEDDSAP